VEMPYTADLADPLFDVRDVVESFRSYRVTPSDWDQTLRHAIAALSELPPQAQVSTLLPGLLPNLDLLLARGLENSQQVIDKVAGQVAIVLSETRIPGIPAPEDDDWTFSEANVS
jgi:hypothetical protein